MRTSWLDLGVVFALLLGACGKDEPAAGFVQHEQSTPRGDGGLPEVEEAVPDPLAPVVAILEPLATRDPNADTILTANTVTVRCNVTKSRERYAREVDESSVKIAVLAAGVDAKPLLPAVNAVSSEEFDADINLAELPNGPLRFTCSANDLGKVPLPGWAHVDTFLDLGPTIEIMQPLEGQTFALVNPVAIKFQVHSAPVKAGDTEADFTALRLDVSGHEIEVTQSKDEPGVYAALVDFDEKTVFTMSPSTALITVSATSSRTPDAPVRRAVVNINLDSEPPTISVSSPVGSAAGPPLVRGNVTLVVNLDDASGVDRSSVVGSISSTPAYELRDWVVMGTTYSKRFDTTSFGDTLSQLTITITASDLVGNQKSISHVLRLDNVAPILSLDPPRVREWKIDGDKTVCSAPFDPLGQAISDGEHSADTTLFRLMIWDRTNKAQGEPFGFIAGVKSSTVSLYAQLPNTALVIDADHDGTCDAINTKPDNGMLPIPLALSALTVRGSSYFAPKGPDNDFANPPAPGCDKGGSDTMPPHPICEIVGGDLIRAVSQPIQAINVPAIYAFAPSNAEAGYCEGSYWQGAHMSFGSGWVCVAARAEDEIGNIGISPPIRVCYGDTPCPPEDMPSCTDDCSFAPADDMRTWADGGFILHVQ